MSVRGYQPVLYSEPAALGLVSNCVSALLAAVSNLSSASPGFAAPWFILVGGFAQAAASLGAWRKNDTLGGTAFGIFSAFWIALAADNLLPQYTAITSSVDSYTSRAQGAAIGTFAVLCIPLLFTAMTLSALLALVIASIGLAFVITSAHLLSNGAVPASAAGIFQLIICATTLYGAIFYILKGLTRQELLPLRDPVFSLNLKKNEGDSNSDGRLPGPDTWGEPSALGLAGTTISASVLAASLLDVAFRSSPSSHNGPVSTALPSAPWLIACGTGLQLASTLLYFIKKMSSQALVAALQAVFWAAISVCGALLAGPVGSYSDLRRLVASAAAQHIHFALATFLVLFIVCAFPLSGTISRAHAIQSFFFAASIASIIAASAVSPSSLASLLVGSPTTASPATAAAVAAAFLLCLALSSFYTFSAVLINTVTEKPLLPVGKAFVILDKLFPAGEKTTGPGGSMEIEHAKSGSSGDAAAASLGYLFQTLPCVMLASACLDPRPAVSDLLAPILAPCGAAQAIAAYLSFNAGDSLGGTLNFSHAMLWSSLAFGFAQESAAAFSSISSSSSGTPTAASVSALSSSYPSVATGLFAYTALEFAFTVVSAWTSRLVCISFLMFDIALLLSGLALAGKMSGTAPAIFLIASAVFALATCNMQAIHDSIGRIYFSPGKPFFKMNRDRRRRGAADDNSAKMCELLIASKVASIDRAAAILNGGGVIGIPTDTVYCVCASTKHPAAVERLYSIKRRPKEKPVSLWIANFEQLMSSGIQLHKNIWSLARSVWPGPVSLVIKRGQWMRNLGLTGASYEAIGNPKDDSVACRIPDSVLTIALIQKTGPLAVTSANPSGMADCTHHDEVFKLIGDKIDLLLCDGPSRELIASTVVDATNHDALSFYRIGCVSEAKIRGVFLNCIDENDQQQPMPGAGAGKQQEMQNLNSSRRMSVMQQFNPNGNRTGFGGNATPLSNNMPIMMPAASVNRSSSKSMFAPSGGAVSFPALPVTPVAASASSHNNSNRV